MVFGDFNSEWSVFTRLALFTCQTSYPFLLSTAERGSYRPKLLHPTRIRERHDSSRNSFLSGSHSFQTICLGLGRNPPPFLAPPSE